MWVALLFLLLLFVIVNVSIVGFSLRYGISPMPSSAKAKDAILSLIPHSQGVIFELGSGWGTLAYPLARSFPSLQVQAYEISPLPFLISKGFLRCFPLSNLTIERRNFYELSFHNAEGVVCYLFPGAMRRLKEKFERELKPGSFVITNCFEVPGWTADVSVDIHDTWHSRVFLYTRPIPVPDPSPTIPCPCPNFIPIPNHPVPVSVPVPVPEFYSHP